MLMGFFSGLKFRYATSVCLINGKNMSLNWGSQHFFQGLREISGASYLFTPIFYPKKIRKVVER